MSFGDDLYSDLAPVALEDAENGSPLLTLCQAVGSMFDPIEELARDSDGNPGWSQMLDIDRAPTDALPWLAQFVGVTVDTGADDPTQRAQISAEQGFARGTPAAIVAAAQRYLTGTKNVFMLERDGDVYTLTITTRTAETPDEDAVLAALTAAKPAGIILQYSVVDGQSWDELIANYATWADVIAAYSTWNDVINNTP